MRKALCLLAILSITACAVKSGSIRPETDDTVPVKLNPVRIEIQEKEIEGVDLGIGDDRLYGRPVSWSQNEPIKREGMLASIAESRPGVFIAWRNTKLVEEVEVRVRNLGNKEGRGEVYVDVLDEEGRLLLHLEPPQDQKVVALPPRNRGGQEGKIVKMLADRRLNRLIDLYDRIRLRYDVRATVKTMDTVDANPSDNVKVKAYNIPFRAVPGQRHILNYVFTNLSGATQSAKWKLESTNLPSGWALTGSMLTDKTLTVQQGEKLRGFLTFDVPIDAKEGDLVELRLSLLDAKTNEVLGQHEWFLVYDTKPPFISNVKVTQKEGKIIIEEVVSDPGSGVLEASGVWSDFSTDDGRTYAHITHNYNFGNFVDPTTFRAEIGPFRSGTKVIMHLYASDTAGNVSRNELGEVIVE